MKKKRIIFIVLVLIWGLVINLFSAQNADQSAAQSNGITIQVVRIVYPDYDNLPAEQQAEVFDQLHHIIRKMAHFGEYCVFSVLISCLLLTFRRFSDKLISLSITATLTSCVYSITDEIHQLYVPGRSGSPKDVLIDTSGALFGACFISLIITLYRKRKKPQDSETKTG